MSDSPNYLTAATSSPYLPIVLGLVRGVVGLASSFGFTWALTVSGDQITMAATAVVAVGMLGWSAWQKIEAIREKRRAEVAAAVESSRATMIAGRPMPVTVTETPIGTPNVATMVPVDEIAKAATVTPGITPTSAPAV